MFESPVSDGGAFCFSRRAHMPFHDIARELDKLQEKLANSIQLDDIPDRIGDIQCHELLASFPRSGILAVELSRERFDDQRRLKHRKRAGHLILPFDVLPVPQWARAGCRVLSEGHRQQPRV